MKIKLLLSFLLIAGMTLQAMQEQQAEELAQIQASPKAINKFYENTIVERAARGDIQGALDALQQGLSRGFNVNYQDEALNRTLLHTIVNKKDTIGLVRAVLQAGARPNIQDVRGFTPLHVAMMNPHNVSAIIRELVQAGADVNATSSTGMTPLMMAVQIRNMPAVQALLTIPGTDIDLMQKNAAGMTALDIARTVSSDITKLLASHYMTLKGLGLEYIKKHQDKFTQEHIKQLPLELQEALQKG